MIKTIIQIARTNEDTRTNEELISIIAKVFKEDDVIITRNKTLPSGYTKPLRNYTVEIYSEPNDLQLNRLKHSLNIPKLLLETIQYEVKEV